MALDIVIGFVDAKDRFSALALAKVKFKGHVAIEGREDARKIIVDKYYEHDKKGMFHYRVHVVARGR